jgi:hypothetical protein
MMVPTLCPEENRDREEDGDKGGQGQRWPELRGLEGMHLCQEAPGTKE